MKHTLILTHTDYNELHRMVRVFLEHAEEHADIDIIKVVFSSENATAELIQKTYPGIKDPIPASAATIIYKSK